MGILALEMLRERIKDEPFYADLWSHLRAVEDELDGKYTGMSWDPQPYFYEERYMGNMVPRDVKKAKFRQERENLEKLKTALQRTIYILDERIRSLDSLLKGIWEEEHQEALLEEELERIKGLDRRRLFRWRRPKPDEMDYHEDVDAKVCLVYLTERIKAVITIRDTGKPGKKRWRLDAVLRCHKGATYPWWEDLPGHWNLIGKVDGANRATLKECKALILKKQQELLELIEELEERAPLPGKKPRKRQRVLQV